MLLRGNNTAHHTRLRGCAHNALKSRAQNINNRATRMASREYRNVKRTSTTRCVTRAARGVERSIVY